MKHEMITPEVLVNDAVHSTSHAHACLEAKEEGNPMPHVSKTDKLAAEQLLPQQPTPEKKKWRLDLIPPEYHKARRRPVTEPPQELGAFFESLRRGQLQ